jgi:hypothetical protein
MLASSSSSYAGGLPTTGAEDGATGGALQHVFWLW